MYNFKKLKQSDIFVNKFKITNEIYSGFISIFKDNNPLHTNLNFAIEKNFKSCVMHGNILNGFISFFVGECLPLKNVIIHSQSINYKNPFYLEDELKLTVEIVNIFESVNAIDFKFIFTNTQNIIIAKGKIQIGII
jgi:3-hydroxybutyryl-CoA dehydratase